MNVKLEQRLLPIARRWNGVIPIWEARRQGIDSSQIRHWAQNNPDVERTDRGVYAWFRDDDDIDWGNMPLARAVAWAGPEAYIWGPSVLEQLGIGDVGGFKLFLAVPKGRRSSEFVSWHVTEHKADDTIAGLPCENPRDAVFDGLPYLDSDKQERVIADAAYRGLITADEAKELEERYRVRR